MFTLDFPFREKSGTTTKGGGGSCVYQLANGLHKRGFDVTVVAGKEREYLGESVKFKVIRVSNNYFGVRSLKILGSALMFFRSIYLSGNYDIVHSHNPPGFIASYLFSKRTNTANILTMHGPWADLRQKTRPFARIVESTCLKLADIVTADSYSLIEQLQKSYNKGGIVPIQNAIETDIFKPRNKLNARKKLDIPSDKLVVLYTGRFVREKHVDILLDTLPELVKKKLNILLLLAGGGFDHGIVTDWLNKNEKYSKFVKIIPFLPYAEMPLLYNSADVFVLPTEAEGLSRSLLEAMASGLACVATDIGPNKEVLSSNKGVLVKLNKKSMGDGISKALTPKIRKHLGQRSRNYTVKHHSVKARVDKFIELYKKLAKNQ